MQWSTTDPAVVGEGTNKKGPEFNYRSAKPDVVGTWLSDAAVVTLSSVQYNTGALVETATGVRGCIVPAELQVKRHMNILLQLDLWSTATPVLETSDSDSTMSAPARTSRLMFTGDGHEWILQAGIDELYDMCLRRLDGKKTSVRIYLRRSQSRR